MERSVGSVGLGPSCAGGDMAGGGAWDASVSVNASDEAVMATNTDATECKRCAVELGYWRDEYIAHFARRGVRRAPEIHCGYYARVKGVEMFVHQFLERCGTQCQIINLGCGFDTLFWRLKDCTQAVSNFIELDFPSVTAKKCQIIKRNKQLLEKIAKEDGEVMIRSGDLHADGYHLLGCDLRCLGEVRRKLAAAGVADQLPTLLLAECVLVYLRPDAADALLRELAQRFPRSVLVQYEQCNLGDRFGELMLRNLGARGCPLGGGASGAGGGGGASGVSGGSPSQQAARLRSLGWAVSRSWDMRAVWAALPDEERARVERLEMLDERELLQQLNAHYALSVAAQGELFADMDLNA